MMDVLKILLGALIGFVLGSLREGDNRDRRAKDDFLAVIAPLRNKLDMSGFREHDFYEPSLKPIGEAVYKLQPFLRRRNGNQLVALLKEYQAKSSNRELTTKEGVFDAVLERELQGGKGIPVVEKLKGYLDRFARFGR